MFKQIYLLIKYAAQVRMAVKCESGIKHHKTIKYTVMCYNDDLILFLSFFSVAAYDDMLDTACYKSVYNRPNSFKNVNICSVLSYVITTDLQKTPSLVY
jgi:hypothetical protein